MRKDIRRICISLALLAVIGCCYFLWSRPISHEADVLFWVMDQANIWSVMDFGEVIYGHLMEIWRDITDISGAKAYLLDKYEVIKGITVPTPGQYEALLQKAKLYYCDLFANETQELWKEILVDLWESILYHNE